MRGISWLPERLLGSQEGFCSMELVKVPITISKLSCLRAIDMISRLIINVTCIKQLYTLEHTNQ